MQAVTVYCASSTALEPHFSDAASMVGRELAARSIRLVYGGGCIGLMGAVARATKAAGGKVTGIITRQLVALEQGWDGCDELLVVDTMRERKRLLEECGEAFLILPGGLGTYEEFFEILVGRYLKNHAKPIGVVNDHGYYDPMIAMIDHGVEHRFIRPAVRDLLFVHHDPVDVINAIVEVAPPRAKASECVAVGSGLAPARRD